MSAEQSPEQIAELIKNGRIRASEIRERWPATSTALGDANWIDMLAAALASAALALEQGESEARAAIERVRALETFSITDSHPAWTAVDHDELLAALDGAPEPEWEYVLVTDTGDVWEYPEKSLEYVRNQLHSRTRFVGGAMMRRRKPPAWEQIEREGESDEQGH